MILLCLYMVAIFLIFEIVKVYYIDGDWEQTSCECSFFFRIIKKNDSSYFGVKTRLTSFPCDAHISMSHSG